MEPRLSPWLAVALRTAVLAVPVLAAVRPVMDADIWWHLAVGEWVVSHGEVTTTDPFSTHGADRPWIAYSWLFEVVLFLLHQQFGLVAVLAYRVLLGVLVLASFQHLVDRCEKRFLISSMLGFLAALALHPLLSERPWLVTILFTTLTLEVVLDLREGRRRWTFYLLPICYVVWANVHIQFVYGFVVLSVACAAPIVDRVLRLPAVNLDVRGLIAMTLLCPAATLINPYGIRLYVVVWEYATQPGPFRIVEELTAMNFRASWAWLVLALTLATAAALGRSGRGSSFEVLFFAFAAVSCFRAQRDLWVIVLAALVILPAQLPTPKALDIVRVVGRFERLLTLGLVLLFAVFLTWARGMTSNRLDEEEAKSWPAEAALELNRLKSPGPLYNSFNMGGYLIWKAPNHPVSIDGRTNLHGEERIERYQDTWAGLKGWDRDEELMRANIVFADARVGLTSVLRLDGRFRKVYEDKQAVIFVRIR